MTVRLSGLAEEQMRTILSNYRSTNNSKKAESSQGGMSQIILKFNFFFLRLNVNRIDFLLAPRRGLKRRRRAKDSSVGEESTDMDVSQPSTSTGSKYSDSYYVLRDARSVCRCLTDREFIVAHLVRDRTRRVTTEKESARKMMVSANTRSPKKMKSPVSVSSDSDDDKPLAKEVSVSRNQRSRTLRARKTWNYAKMLESNSDNSNDSDGKQEELRPRRQRRKSDMVAAGGGVVAVNRLRRNLQTRHYVENSDSSEEDDDEGVNIRVSVSSRGRIRRLTAKARASVFRD